jgi:hypothetical protein
MAIAIPDRGIMAMPIKMAVIALYFLKTCVTPTTKITTTNGFTFASHSGLASSPNSLITYLGMVAYN